MLCSKRLYPTFSSTFTFCNAILSDSQFFDRGEEQILCLWLHLAVSHIHGTTVVYPSSSTGRTYSSDGVIAISFGTFHSFVSACRHNNRQTSEKRRPETRPLLSNTTSNNIRQGPYSIQTPLSVLRLFQAPHILLDKVCICIETNLLAAKGVIKAYLPLMCRDIFRLRTKRRLQSSNCIKLRTSYRNRRNMARPRIASKYRYCSANGTTKPIICVKKTVRPATSHSSTPLPIRACQTLCDQLHC